MNDQEKHDHEIEHDEIFSRKCDQQFAIEQSIFVMLEYNLRRVKAIVKITNEKYQDFETEKKAGPVDECEKVEFAFRSKLIIDQIFDLEYLIKDHVTR